jgi:hypothetical protein
MVIAPWRWHWSSARRFVLELRWCALVVYQPDEDRGAEKKRCEISLGGCDVWQPMRLVWRLLVPGYEVPQGQGQSLASPAAGRIRGAAPAQREVRAAAASNSRAATHPKTVAAFRVAVAK